LDIKQNTKPVDKSKMNKDKLITLGRQFGKTKSTLRALGIKTDEKDE